MAIAAPHYRCLLDLHAAGELPQGGSILEIGEANWYEDIEVPKEIGGPDPFIKLGIRYFLDNYAVVKAIYEWLFATRDVVSIDLHGPTALQLDLNGPIDLKRQFTTVFNHGTAEHIFNVANVFKVMHDHCAVGGLLIHESPFTGWIDHGFYTLQPTLYYDLARANGYAVVAVVVTQIQSQLAMRIVSREHLLAFALHVPNNAMLFVAMRKTTDASFRVPMQGVYADAVSDEALKAWHTLR